LNSSTDMESGDPRIYFAAERTLLAWIRTGLSMMGFGFVVARFGLFLREMAAVQGVYSAHRGRLSLWFGTALVLLGVVTNLIAAVQHYRFQREFLRGEPPRLNKLWIGITLAFLLSVIGLAMAIYLILVR